MTGLRAAAAAAYEEQQRRVAAVQAELAERARREAARRVADTVRAVLGPDTDYYTLDPDDPDVVWLVDHVGGPLPVRYSGPGTLRLVPDGVATEFTHPNVEWRVGDGEDWTPVTKAAPTFRDLVGLGAALVWLEGFYAAAPAYFGTPRKYRRRPSLPPGWPSPTPVGEKP